jgi:peptidyl-prolyl cis-trans isomerase D
MIRVLQKDNGLIKAIFALIIGATIIFMVITLVPGIFDNSSTTGDPNVYAKIRTPGFWGHLGGDTEVKTQEVERAFQQQVQQNHYPESLARAFLYPRIGTQIVEQKVLLHEAERLGLQVSEDDMRSFLQHGTLSQYIFPNGKFIGQEQYLNFVQSAFQLSVPDFEELVKQDLEMQRLQAVVTGGVMISDADVRTQAIDAETKVKFSYAVISGDDLKKSINPSDADLQTWFKQNAARYSTAVPETRKIQFFAFTANDVPGAKAAPTDADLQAYYAAHQKDYTVPEQVQTRHILITVPKGADAKTDAVAKAKAQDILKQIKAGGNFADLAKKNSDDPGSKDQGGELPMIPTSGLDPAYAKAAMALNPGQTSDLVRSSFGYHIIQTEKKDVAHSKPLAEVKDQIVKSLTQDKMGAVETAFATKLAGDAKKSGMQATADANHLKLVTTDYVGADGTIATLPDSTTLLHQAFGADKGGAPATASTGEGYAVFQVMDVKTAHAPNFADYKSHILDDYRTQKEPELMNSQLIKLSDRAKQLNDLKKAAAEMKITVKDSDLIGKDGQVPELGAMTSGAGVAFTLPKGGISGPINSDTNGSVLQVEDKQEPSADDLAKNFQVTKDKLLNAKREQAFQVFAMTLMDRYEKANAITYSKQQQAPSLPMGGQ